MSNQLGSQGHTREPASTPVHLPHDPHQADLEEDEESSIIGNKTRHRRARFNNDGDSCWSQYKWIIVIVGLLYVVFMLGWAPDGMKNYIPSSLTIHEENYLDQISHPKLTEDIQDSGGPKENPKESPKEQTKEIPKEESKEIPKNDPKPHPNPNLKPQPKPNPKPAINPAKQQPQSSGKNFFIKPDPLLALGPGISGDQIKLAKQLLEYQDNPTAFDKQKELYEKKYNISKYEEKPFCILIPTYNNVQDERYQRNIDSLLTQDYSNYRVLVIDDASSDETGEILRGYLSGNPVYQEMLDKRVTIQVNKKRMMSLPNQLDAVKNFCKPEELFMILDGDDFLLGRQVLKLFNAVFSSKDVWIAYSNFLTMGYKSGFSREYPNNVISNNWFRRVYFGISHLRVFYTKLLLKVKDSDLRDKNGNYYRAANDVAVYFPIMEMTGSRQVYIKELCYFYNSKTGLNNHVDKKTEQKKNEMEIRLKKPYEPIDELF